MVTYGHSRSHMVICGLKWPHTQYSVIYTVTWCGVIQSRTVVYSHIMIAYTYGHIRSLIATYSLVQSDSHIQSPIWSETVIYGCIQVRPRTVTYSLYGHILIWSHTVTNGRIPPNTNMVTYSLTHGHIQSPIRSQTFTYGHIIYSSITIRRVITIGTAYTAKYR